MKWFLIITLIVVIMMIAYSVNEQYRDKYDFYKNLKTFLNQFKLNLSFKQEKIKDFLNNMKPKKQFKVFIEEYQNYLKTNTIDLSQLKILETDEQHQLETIIKNIGNMNSTNEINQLNTFLIEIDEKLTIADKEKRKLCPMILKLSLLFAIGIAIILI